MNLSPSSVTKRFHYGDRIRPHRDWFVLLIVFLILLVGSVAYNLLTFSQVTKGQKVGNAEATTTPPFSLDKTKALFDARAAERSRYQDQYRFVDPSQ